MNHYILIHRLTGPAILLLLGIVALLSESHVVHFSIFVPLLLILLGVLKLAERMALAGWVYPGGPGAGMGAAPQPPGAAAYGASNVAPAPVEPGHDFGQDFNNSGNGPQGGKL